jgi:hypothetical protein
MSALTKLSYLLICTLLIITSACNDEDDDYRTYSVKVQLVYPDGFSAAEGVTVTLEDNTNKAYEAKTDVEGKAVFTVPAGIYKVTATESRSLGATGYVLNGSTGNLNVGESWVDTYINVNMVESKQGSLIVKELYAGGCPDNDGKLYNFDKYVIVYNNSNVDVSLENIALAMTLPYNSNGTNYDYTDGKLFYEAEGWIPAGQAIWYFQQKEILEPGKQMVIALNKAVDHTSTYTNSINFSNASYYCTYDPEVFTHASYYSPPSEVIPTSHYLKAVLYGIGTAWSLSNNSPAFFLFETQGTTPRTFANDASYTNFYNGSANQVRKKCPVEWVVDGVEVFRKGESNNQKRFTSTVDNGYVELTNSQGYTLYRNVDEEATKAIEGNEGKLVYGYSLGEGTTDPSGIDAEASIKNGARIIYKDTNNSSADFHQRTRASLRD